MAYRPRRGELVQDCDQPPTKVCRVAAEKSQDADETPTRSAEIAEFWETYSVDPVEIALLGGVGLTLRHYRTTQVPVRDTSDTDIDDELDAEYTGELAETDKDADDTVEAVDEELAETDEDDDQPELVDQDDVVFLANRDGLLLFRTPEALVTFLRSNAPHDLRAIPEYDALATNVTAAHLVPDPADTYELDLVVENLRGGRDAWDAQLLVSAGEIARDVAQACDLADVQSALSAGSPLDDLDDALRDGGFWARRRLRKIGVETAALSWRSVIGKIAGASQWRD